MDQGSGFSAAQFEEEMRRAESESSLGTVNIVVTGSSGVGKSTLINAVFCKKLAKTATGKPETMRIEKITDPSLPLCLYDTRGLEIQDAKETINEIRQFILQLRSELVVADQIHVVWLCILEASNRVEPVHQAMAALFKEYEIPCIVTITQSMGNDDFADTVKTLLPGLPVVQVMAETMTRRNATFPAEGLDRLVEETLLVLPTANQKAFEYCQKASWVRKEAIARSAINWATAAVVAAAAIPIPGGHSAACITIETAMLLKINNALGVRIEEQDRKAVVMGTIGIIGATVGGKMVFIELTKLIPGVGTVAGAIMGAAVAGPVCRVLGLTYLKVIMDIAKSGEPMPGVSMLIDMLKREYNRNKSDYIKEASA